MTEEFLSFIWQNKLFNSHKLTFEGERITILNTGDLNRDSGPDFFNTRIRIGKTVWAGNAEIHVRASDWIRHHHHTDPAFDNVIFHITLVNDEDVYTSKGRKVLTIPLDFEEHLFDKYKSLVTNHKWIACVDDIKTSDTLFVTSLLSRIGVERLEQRNAEICRNLDLTVSDWEEVFYRLLARSYGFHLNSQPFEQLALSLPFTLVSKYCENIFQLEALFFGQAGFLHDDYSEDEYYNSLKKEYWFFLSKYHLQPIDTHLWKFMRLRPRNFPVIRIAQFVSLIHNRPGLLSRILRSANLAELEELFAVDVSEFWERHFGFGESTDFLKKPLGQQSAQIIIINAIVPFLFTYGSKMGMKHLQDRALKILEEVAAENNSVIKQWVKLGIVPKNAFESQALLQLKNEYCEKKKCLECSIGVKIISRASF